MLFFFSWIFIFSTLFQILGLELFDDEYDGFNIKLTYLVYTYRNAIGDANPPKTIYWLEQKDKYPIAGNLMIILIWVFWLLSQWLVLIILLNFLIAIIGQSYDQIMSQ